MILLITVIPITLLIILMAVLMVGSNKPLNRQDFKLEAEKVIEKYSRKKKYDIAMCGIDSASKKLKLEHAVGIPADTPFHLASVGKTFTATLLFILEEQGVLSLNDSISKFMDSDTTSDLFMYENTDYSTKVTVRQLLEHTSGVADYIEDENLNGPDMRNIIAENPDKKFTVQELITFTKDNQKAVNAPGMQFHYSDTGYLLAGLIAEKATGIKFHQLLSEYIFDPLKMENTYMPFRSSPASGIKKMAPIDFEGTDLTNKKALTVDWAGGGIVSTINDLHIFNHALFNNELISTDSLSKMLECGNSYMKGIDYGIGVMKYRFEEFFFLLKSLPHLSGHMGALGTQLFYDSETKSSFVLNLGSTRGTEDSVKLLIELMLLFQRTA